MVSCRKPQKSGMLIWESPRIVQNMHCLYPMDKNVRTKVEIHYYLGCIEQWHLDNPE